MNTKLVANAGAPNNDQISDEFPGGYAGKCPEGTEWKLVDVATTEEGERWQCSGEPDWKQAVFLPEITDESETVGLMVMPYNFRDTESEANAELRLNWDLTSWKTAFSEVPNNDATNNQDFESMTVSCYPGKPPFGSLSSLITGSGFKKTVDIPGTDIENPIGVYGNIDLGDKTSYTCQWSYDTKEGRTINSPGCVIQLQRNEPHCTSSFGGVKDHFIGENGKEFPSGTKIEDKKYSASEFKELVETNNDAEGVTVS